MSCPTPEISPGGVRTAKISIVSGNFLDLSSLHFSFLVRNEEADAAEGAPGHPLLPLSAIPHSFWRRIRISVNGAVVEDLNFANRVEEQISRFLSTNKRRNVGDAGFGWEYLNDSNTRQLTNHTVHHSTMVGQSKTVRTGRAVRVTWRPLGLGFLQTSKFLPMLGGAASGLCIELEAASLASLPNAILCAKYTKTLICAPCALKKS